MSIANAAHHSMIGGGKKVVIPFLRFNSNGDTTHSINLNIAPSVSDVYEIVCRKIPDTTGDTQFFGVYAGNDSRDVRLFYTSGTVLYWDFGSRRAYGEYLDFADGTNFIKVIADNSHIETPKKSVSFQPYTGQLSTYSMFLFGIRTSAYHLRSSQVQSDISSFKITRSGNVIMDLIAKNDATRGGYMLDQISGNGFYPMDNGRYTYMEEVI